jgi:outer membrane protein assembly factor BamE (lipoprotein component of BamABCDE complex)
MKYLFSVLILILISGCGVQQKLSVSFRLTPGMAKDEVERIMGAPVKSDFKKNVEDWHYCKTGISSDEFLALFFYDGKLVEKLNYSVTLADTRGATGSCEKFIKMGNYREPDKVIELRMR